MKKFLIAILLIGCGVEVEEIEKIQIDESNAYKVVEAIKATTPEIFLTILNAKSCENGGEIKSKGERVEFINCVYNGNYLSGVVEVKKEGCVNEVCESAKIDFLSNFYFQDNYKFITIKSGEADLNNLKYNDFNEVDSIEGEENIEVIYNAENYKSDFRFVLNYYNGFYNWYYKSGEIYLQSDKYIEIDNSYDMSLTPIVYDTYSGEFISGYAKFLGDNQEIEVNLKEEEVKVNGVFIY